MPKKFLNGINVTGTTTLNNVVDAGGNTNKFLVLESNGIVKYRTSAETIGDIGAISTTRQLTINGITYDLSQDRSWTISTGSVLNSRTITYFTATAGQTTFNVNYTPGGIDVFYNGSNLDDTEYTAINGTSITLNTACAVGDKIKVVAFVDGVSIHGLSPISFNSSTGEISISQASSTANGYLTSTDWNTFNNKLSTSRTLTVNGVTYDLTANRSWSIAPGGTTGQILAKNSGTDYDWGWIDNYADKLQHQVKLGENINKGQAVYVFPTGDNASTNMTVKKASNNAESTSSKTMGLIATSGVTNDFVQLITEGLLPGIDTSTANQGDPVWLGTSGNLIFGLANKPVAPAHLVFVGVVTRVHATNGEIFVKVQNGFELDELHDVLIVSKVDNQALVYEASTGLWKNKTLSTSWITEGTNLYYTTARVNSDFDTRLATKSTTNLAEGTNLYYTDARVASYLTTNSYATQTYVNTAISNLVAAAPAALDTLNELAAALGNDANFATTTSTALGNRLRIDIGTQGLTSTQQGYGRTNLGLGSLATLSSIGNGYITDVAWSKVTGAPAFITSYTETDTLATVTGRGATTSTAVTFSGGATISNLLLNGAAAYTEGSLALGAMAANEGGQLVLQKGIGNTYATHLDNYSDKFRIMYGTNTGSSGVAFQVNMSTGQITIPFYTSTSSFTGTSTAYLAVDASGNVITVVGGSGGVTSITGGTGVTASASTGAVTLSIGQSVATSAQVTFDSVITGNNGNGTNFRIGDDSWIGDINVANTFRVTGLQDATKGYIVFGNSDATALGRSGTGALTYGGNTIYHAGNLTNLNQLTNGPGYITGITSSMVTTALGYTPYNGATNPNGYITGVTNISGYAAMLNTYDTRTIAPNSHTAYRLSFGFTSWSNNNTADWADYLHLRSYGDASGGADNLIMFKKNGIGMRIWQQSFGSATAYSSYVDMLHSGNYTSYSPSLTGSGASGTWGINITGTVNSTGGDFAIKNSTSNTGTTWTRMGVNNAGQGVAAFVGTYNGNASVGAHNSALDAWANLYVNCVNNGGGGGSVYLPNNVYISTNTVIHSGNIGSYAIAAGGSWGADLTANGWTRQVGLAYAGGEWVVLTNPANGGQVSTLIDGSYFAGENGGHWSLNASNQYASRMGFYHDGSTMNFRTNNAVMSTANIRVYPVSESWAEGISFIMPSTSVWGGLRWQRQRSGSDGNWYIGFTALDSSDDLVFGANNGGSQIDNILRLRKDGSILSYSPVGTGSHGRNYLFRTTQSAAGNFIPFSVESDYGNHSWGMVARFRINQVGADRPSIQFSAAGGDDRWSIGYCTSSDWNFRISQNMGYREDNANQDGWGTMRVMVNTSGVMSVPQGYVSTSNPWGTADSAYFPNGITTAGGTNWIYGSTTYIGNAPSNGAGHQFWNDGIQYSTQKVSIGTNDTSRSYWDGRSTRAGLLISGVAYPAIHIDATDSANTTHGAVISLTGVLSAGGYRRWGMGIPNRDPGVFSIGWFDNQTNPHYGVGVGWSYPARLSLDTSGNLTVSGDITAYGSLSDANLKIIKKKVPNALSGVMQLSGYCFDWKEDKNRLLNIKEDIGVIAQEVEKVFPELARTGDDGNMSVRYQGLTAVLIEAVKELKQENDELRDILKRNNII